jgi:hypothetical protein
VRPYDYHNKPPPPPFSNGWKRVLRRIGEKGTSTTEDIVTFCIAEGLEIPRPNVFSQTCKYVKKGLLLREAKGVFNLTRKGANIAGVGAEVLRQRRK